jgi:enoyl-CoA hydratase
MDMILTGRPVDAAEALSIGLVNRLTPASRVCETAEELTADIARWPQRCLRLDMASAQAQAGTPEHDALRVEHAHGRQVLAAEDFLDGARRFAAGAGRHGSFGRDAQQPDG